MGFDRIMVALPRFVEAAGLTLELTLIAIVMGLILGLILALGRLSKKAQCKLAPCGFRLAFAAAEGDNTRPLINAAAAGWLEETHLISKRQAEIINKILYREQQKRLKSVIKYGIIWLVARPQG